MREIGRGNLSRREFLQRGAGITLAATGLAACGQTAAKTTPTPHPAPAPTPPPSPSGPPTAAAWAALAATLSGRLVLPDQGAYATARLVYDLRYESATPAAIAFCASPTDVQRVLDFARNHAIQPIPRCGGHSYGGYSTGAGLIVDVTPMKAVTLSADARSATVGAGARLIDVYAGTAQSGVLVPGGSCASVGISGLALGGGIGVVGRRYGLTCDAIQSLSAVAADASLLNVSATSEPDLYWASRGGGGGNFAIVTAFEFATNPIPPLVQFGLDFPWGVAGEVLSSWQAWIADAPDELWSNCLLLCSGGGLPTVRVGGVYTGTTATLSALTAKLTSAIGTQPSSQFAAPSSYLATMLAEAGCSDLTVAQCHLPSVNPAGKLARSAFLAKSAYVSSPFTNAAITAATAAMTSFQSELPNLGGALAFDSYGGAINSVAADATAFVHRDALCQIQLSGSLPAPIDPASVSAVQSWLSQAAATLAPYCDGEAYQNYIDPTLGDWQQAYYGANFARLVAVKHSYDPDNVFHFAQSIPTTV